MESISSREIGTRHWTGEQGAAVATARNRFPGYTCVNVVVTPSHEGSTVRRGLALPWANRFKSGLLDIPPYSSIYIYYELRSNVRRWSRYHDKDGAYR